jgi:two-component system cell cycle sensor histidine kinase/response regulator CckA
VRSSFDQAMVNLVVNARDAMPGGGNLTITTQGAVLGEDAVRHGAPRPGPHVAVRVSDSGHGIRPEHLHQVFDPFFTTKSAGNGTGLGLTTVYAFIRNSGGHIDVSSVLGRGTTISMYFPEPDDFAPPSTVHSISLSDAIPHSQGGVGHPPSAILSLREPPLGATLSARELEASSLRAGGTGRPPLDPMR